MNNDIRAQADLLSYQACPLFPKKPADIEGSFTMYAYDRFANLMIHGMCEHMLNDGCTEQQIKDVLASKHVRWMLDGADGQVIELGYKLAMDYGMSKEAKE